MAAGRSLAHRKGWGAPVACDWHPETVGWFPRVPYDTGAPSATDPIEILELARDDADLLAVVQALGPLANGAGADLLIVEVPDGTYSIVCLAGIEEVFLGPMMAIDDAALRLARRARRTAAPAATPTTVE